MATITLYANKINQMPGLIKDVKTTVSNYKTDLLSLRNKTLNINKSVCNLDDVMSSISSSTQLQDQKIQSLEKFYQENETFIADAARVDDNVADVVNERKDDFYEKFSYLKPDSEKSGWEKFCDGLKAVGDWCKENWKVIVTVVLVIAAIVVIVVFPAISPLLFAIAKGAVWGAGIGGLIGGTMSHLSGGSFFEGFMNGAFDGAIAGIVSGGMIFAFTGGVAGVALTLGQTLLDGAVSGAALSLVSNLGDIYIRGIDISLGQLISNAAISGAMGAAFAGAFYGLSKGFSALKTKFFNKGASGARVNGLGNSIKSNTGKVIDTTPSKTHTTVTKNPGLKGEPNSSVDIMGKNGELSTRRWFDGNGNQIRDVDMTNHGNPGKHPEVPHEHGPR